MKIALVSNKYPPFPGGVARAVVTLQQNLESQGHEVHIVTFNFPALLKHEFVHTVNTVYRFWYGAYPVVIPWPFFYKQLRHVLEVMHPDVIHVHHPFGLGAAAARVGKIMRIRTVFTYHSQYDLYAYLYAPCAKNYFQRFVDRKVIRFCNSVDVVIAPSDSVKAMLTKKGVLSEIIVIPTPIQLQFFSSQSIDFKKSLEKPYRLLCVARFVREKNLFLLLDMFTLLGDEFELILAGYGPLLSTLKNYAYTTLGLSKKRVVFIEKPSPDDLKDLYRQAFLFVFASYTETQGLVIGESMAMGTPVVAFDGPGVRDAIQSGINGYIVFSKEEMAERIKELGGNKKVYVSFVDALARSLVLFDSRNQLVERVFMHAYGKKSKTNVF